MKTNLRILYLKDPSLANDQQYLLLEKEYEVRAVSARQDLKKTLLGFSPHILLFGEKSSITANEVLDLLERPNETALIIMSVTKGNLKEVLPYLEKSSFHLNQTKFFHKEQKEQKELEERYKSMYENSLDGILITEPNGNILAANPAACAMFEMTEKELRQKGRSGIVDPENPRLHHAIAQREKLGKAHTELFFVKKSGQKFPVELTCSVYKDGSGNSKTTIILRDISTRKMVEEQMQASFETYKTIFNQSPVPYWIYDQETFDILDVNEVALKNYGYSREEFLKLNIFDLRPEEEIGKLKEHIKGTIGLNGTVKHGRFIHLKKDGTRIKVEVFGYRLNYEGRNCRLVACIDITEREESVKNLKEKQARLSAAQEIAKIGYWELNASTGEVILNEMTYDIWGIVESGKRWTLSSVKHLVHPDDREKFLQAQELSVEKGEEHEVEYRILGNSEEIKWIHERGRVLSWYGDKPEILERTVQDITENKKFLEKIAISEARYKGLVKSQTNYLIRTDMSGNYTYYNDKFFSDFGWLYEDQEILGQPSMSSIMEYHHQPVIEVVERCVLEPGAAFQIEIDKPGRNGGVRTTLWDFVCLVNSEGVPAEIQCVGIDISARVKAERELKDSKFRYQLITEATSDAIWDWDLSTGKLFWGKTLELMFGYDPKEFTTIESWDKIVHSEDSPRVMKELEEAIAGTDSKWMAEYRIKKSNGEYASVVEKGTILRDQEKRAYRMVGAIQDITETRKLQDLLESANKLSRIGSFDFDLVKNELYWSAITREIHEVSEDLEPDLETAIFFYKEGESRERIRKALQKAIEEHVPFDEELQIVTAEGRELWVRAMGKPDIENGRCIRISGSFQDIDKIKQSELEVIRAASEKEILLESIGDAFFAVDHKWIVTYWNSHAARLLSCPKESILNKNLWEVFSDAVGSTFQRNYDATMKDKQKRHFEAYFERTSAWYEVTVYPSNDGLSVFFKDITQRKTRDEKLRELNKSLKAQTRELVTANKGLEQFSYIVSHNLRSPVANIIGLADLLKNADYPPEVRDQFYSEIFSNVERLDTVITDLNSILQVKVDIRARKEKIDLEELISEIKFSIKTWIEEEEAEIICDFSEVPVVTSVKTYLYSIFYNLVANSIKYRQPEVSPVLEIKASKQEEFIVITFSDNGLGINLETKGAEIFNLYKRFHHHVEGKGMGLFMVKTQVEMLGGNITIDSEVNKGTTFTILLKENLTTIEVEDEQILSLSGDR